MAAEIWQAKLVKNRKNAKNRSTSEACSSAQEKNFENLSDKCFSPCILLQLGIKRMSPARHICSGGLAKNFPKIFLWRWVYLGFQSPSTLHSTPPMWLNLWLDLISQLVSILGWISLFNAVELEHENFGPNFFLKIGQVRGAISQKRGRNSKFWRWHF